MVIFKTQTPFTLHIMNGNIIVEITRLNGFQTSKHLLRQRLEKNINKNLEMPKFEIYKTCEKDIPNITEVL